MHLDLDMGKYAVFVWGAYSASAIAIGGLVLMSLRAHATRKKQLDALQAAVEDKRT
ncbi:MAG: heme exporter protein CcmD [Asticcacaulis sp.]|nr:heme exporter protein CcmD [Asticcacaulis sp.]